MNNINEQAVFLQSGDPTIECRTVDSYWPGQGGQKFTVIDPTDGLSKRFQLVKCDSSMTVAPTEGAVAWWLDRLNYVVTTSISAAGGRGNVAGVFRDRTGAGVSQGYASKIVCLQIKGKAPVQFASGTPDATGLIAIPYSTDAKAAALAAGTAATYPALGTTLGVASANVAPVELDLDGQP